MLVEKYLKRIMTSRIKNNGGSIFAATGILIIMVTTIGVVSVPRGSIKHFTKDSYYQSKAAFYAAESSWAEGAMWIDTRSYPPLFSSGKDKIVREYESAFAILPGKETNDSGNKSDSAEVETIDYGYRIKYLESKPMPGSGNNYRKFCYKITSFAKEDQEIEVKISKLYKVGY